MFEVRVAIDVWVDSFPMVLACSRFLGRFPSFVGGAVFCYNGINTAFAMRLIIRGWPGNRDTRAINCWSHRPHVRSSRSIRSISPTIFWKLELSRSDIDLPSVFRVNFSMERFLALVLLLFGTEALAGVATVKQRRIRLRNFVFPPPRRSTMSPDSLTRTPHRLRPESQFSTSLEISLSTLSV